MPLGVFVPARAEDLGLSFAPGFDSAAQGSIAYRTGASRWGALAPGTAGHVFTAGGPNADPSWAQLAHSSLSGLTTGDPHTQYVFKTPATDARNVIDAGDVIPLTSRRLAAATTSTVCGLCIDVNSTGTPGIGFGLQQLVRLKTTTTDNQNASAIETIWAPATHGAQTSLMLVKTVEAGGSLTETLRLGGGNATFGIINGADLRIYARTAGANMEMRGSGLGSPPGFKFTDLGSVDRFFAGLALQAGQWFLGSSANDTVFRTSGHNLWWSMDSGTTGHILFDTAGDLQFERQSSVQSRRAAGIVTSWATSTDASRKARVVHNVWDTAAREGFRIEADGAAPMIGFLGAVAVGRQTLGAASTDLASVITLANNIRTALINLGLGQN